MALSGLIQRVSKSAIDTRHPLRSLARWPAWAVACALRRPVVARFATGGLRMRLTPRLHSFGTTALFIRRDEYEPELRAAARLVPPGSVAIDIGGSYGVFALFLAHYAGPDGRVHSFEPGRFSFAQLSANVALNGFEGRIALHNAAAGDHAGTLRLYHLAESPVNFSVGGVAGVAFEEVPAVRIDEVVPAAEWPRVRFIKVDVEGFEMAALAGAAAIIAAAQPVIMFEVSAAALARQGQSPADVYAFLAGLGYRFFVLDRAGRFAAVTDPIEGNIFAAMRDLSAD